MDEPKPVTRLQLPNDAAYLPIGLTQVDGVAELIGFSEADREKIRLSLQEVALHVINTAFEEDEESFYELICEPVPDRLLIRIRDKGIPHDPDEAQGGIEPDLPESVKQEMRERYLPRALMDAYQFRNLGPEGKETILIKYRKGDPVAQDSRSDKLAGATDRANEGNEQVKPEDITIRWMKASEAIQVCRCVYDSYGYSYAGEFIYYPERVAAMNETGDLKSAVAVTPTGEVVGHYALIFDPNLPAETGVAVIKKRYRQLGLARRLGLFLEEEANRMNLPGIHAKQVTAHAYSQRFCASLGLADCAYLFGHSRQSTSFRGLADELAQRNTDIVSFKFLAEMDLAVVYPPEAHLAMVEKLLQATGRHFKIQTAHVPSTNRQARTVMDVSVRPRRDLAFMHLFEVGEDFGAMMRQRLHRLRCQEVRNVEAFLNLNDPATPGAAAEMEKQAFFFTGVIPASPRGPLLVMQHLSGIAIDPEAIHPVSPLANELLTYINGLGVLG